MSLPTTPAAQALFNAWSESLTAHGHLLGRKDDLTLESIRKTEDLIGQALAALSDTRNQIEKRRLKYSGILTPRNQP